MNIKYKTQIEKFGTCDLEEFKETEINAFRWTFKEINDSRNFEPVYVNYPKRIQDTCKGFALSFHTTKEASIKVYKKLTSNKPNLYKKLGTHIANGNLVPSDGIANSPNKDKHFDFFTYENIDLSNKFTIIESIS